MSAKDITTLLTLMSQRQARLTTTCKEIAEWIDRHGDMPGASKIRDNLKALEADEVQMRKRLAALDHNRPLPRFRS